MVPRWAIGTWRHEGKSCDEELVDVPKGRLFLLSFLFCLLVLSSSLFWSFCGSLRLPDGQSHGVRTAVCVCSRRTLKRLHADHTFSSRQRLLGSSSPTSAHCVDTHEQQLTLGIVRRSGGRPLGIVRGSILALHFTDV